MGAVFGGMGEWLTVLHSAPTMPEARLQRTRRTLPLAYQFGDAAMPRVLMMYDRLDGLRRVEYDIDRMWRRPSETAAERLRHWNVIEGD